MPALKYDYDYYDSYQANKKGVAKNARSLSATKNVSQSARKSVTSDATRNSTRVATRSVTSASNSKATQRKNKNDIDIPVMVKRKVNVEKPKEMKLNKPKAKAKKKAKSKNVLAGICIGTWVTTVLFAVCMRYTIINEKFNEVNALEKELDSVKALNGQLNANIESKTDLSYIEKYAKYQLGMQKPNDSQIVRINYEKQDKISTPLVIEEEKELGFFEKLFNDLLNLVD